jgi:RNA polymerase-binding transcription factor DksA
MRWRPRQAHHFLTTPRKHLWFYFGTADEEARRASIGSGPEPKRTRRRDPKTMSNIELEARDRLMQRRRALRRGMADVREGEPGGTWIDYEASQEPLVESVRRELDEIDAALARIAEGRYGTCQSCGGPMGLQRLRAIPEARYCMGCSGHGVARD